MPYQQAAIATLIDKRRAPDNTNAAMDGASVVCFSPLVSVSARLTSFHDESLPSSSTFCSFTIRLVSILENTEYFVFEYETNIAH